MTASQRIYLIREYRAYIARNWADRHDHRVRPWVRFAISEVRALSLANVGEHSKKAGKKIVEDAQ